MDEQCTAGRVVSWCQWRRREPPEPCSAGCPGWAIFNVGEIQRCDECWAGVPYDDQPSDEDFEALPECRAALRRELAGECGPGPELLRVVAHVEHGAELDAPEECEDNACAGCAWCDEVDRD